jgi:hypothetical protein
MVWGVAVDQVHYHWREIRAVVFWETGEMIERKKYLARSRDQAGKGDRILPFQIKNWI